MRVASRTRVRGLKRCCFGRSLEGLPAGTAPRGVTLVARGCGRDAYDRCKLLASRAGVVLGRNMIVEVRKRNFTLRNFFSLRKPRMSSAQLVMLSARHGWAYLAGDSATRSRIDFRRVDEPRKFSFLAENGLARFEDTVGHV